MSSSKDRGTDCGHGYWDATKRSCICNDGWTTDTNQNIFDGSFVYCGSLAVTADPQNSNGSSTGSGGSGMSKNSIIIISVLCGVGGLLLVALLYCLLCRQRRRRRETVVMADHLHGQYPQHACCSSGAVRAPSSPPHRHESLGLSVELLRQQQLLMERQEQQWSRMLSTGVRMHQLSRVPRSVSPAGYIDPADAEQGWGNYRRYSGNMLPRPLPLFSCSAPSLSREPFQDGFSRSATAATHIGAHRAFPSEADWEARVKVDDALHSPAYTWG